MTPRVSPSVRARSSRHSPERPDSLVMISRPWTVNPCHEFRGEQESIHMNRPEPPDEHTQPTSPSWCAVEDAA
jgi:hypothetical protein